MSFCFSEPRAVLRAELAELRSRKEGLRRAAKRPSEQQKSNRRRAVGAPSPLAPHAMDSIDSVLSLEQHFYDQGLATGTPHGQLHGLFEGRALGREKGWELWEEVGYYEGVSKLWRAILLAQGKEGGRYARLPRSGWEAADEERRALANVEQVLLLVDSFPSTNDSTLLDETNTTAATTDIDIPALLTSIRAKYRAACASLGMRARMVAVAGGEEGGKGASMSL